MSKTNWKKLADKSYFGSWDIDDEDLVLTIKSITQESVKNPQTGKEDLCIIARWVEDYKPMILNVTNCKAIEKALGSSYIEDWANHQIALFKTNISVAGEMVECVRVRAFAPRVNKPKHYCSDCGCEILKANGLDADSVAAYTLKKYGRELCSECASKLKNNGGNN